MSKRISQETLDKAKGKSTTSLGDVLFEFLCNKPPYHYWLRKKDVTSRKVKVVTEVRNIPKGYRVYATTDREYAFENIKHRDLLKCFAMTVENICIIMSYTPTDEEVISFATLVYMCTLSDYRESVTSIEPNPLPSKLPLNYFTVANLCGVPIASKAFARSECMISTMSPPVAVALGNLTRIINTQYSRKVLNH